MVTGGAVCSNWACTESVRGEVSDGLPYLDYHWFHDLTAPPLIRKGTLPKLLQTAMKLFTPMSIP